MESGHYLGEISALCFLHLPPPSSSLPYLLAGTGSQLLFYDLLSGNMITSFQVFKGIRVHGISCLHLSSTSTDTSLTFRVSVFGERRLKLFLFSIHLPNHHHKQTLVQLLSFQSLPNFGHWVLDVCFIQGCLIQGSQFLAIGCSDNSVYFWDTLTSTISYEVRSPDRCLLYTMSMWGDKIDFLHVASGTIYNEIIVWKVVCAHGTPCLNSPAKDNERLTTYFGSEIHVCNGQYDAVLVCRLTGHEGSIFRITWSLDGSKLVSVSDDRSARIWEVLAGQKDVDNAAEVVVSPSTGPVLFGHSARVWDCCISDSLIITVSEDCTCRVWGLDGTQLKIIKEHIGRGVWRCLFDPSSSLLVTAGFDSSIKVHQLHFSSSMGLERCNGVAEEHDRKNIFTIQIPNSKHTALMDSKSEYVRCMHFTSEDALYVTTNNGLLYLAKISDTGDVVWTELFRVSEEIPIVCMSVFPGNIPCMENWIALGDGKGRLAVVRIVDIRTPKVDFSFTWPAEAERQLLGTFWCKSLGHRYIFTADPRGRLKLWNIRNSLQSISEHETGHSSASLVAEFVSCFPTRIICLDASFQEEVLVCGDLRGNLVLFPLLRDLLLGTPVTSVAHISPLNYFKGAHGISSVSSVSIHGSNSSNIELHSTGGDGCICYLEYDRCEEKMEFMGMKQVKEVSLVRSIFPNDNPDNNMATGNYAIGFASADFIIWNLSTETKVAEIPCGGWRRPHTYFLGDMPEMKNCFAFVKILDVSRGDSSLTVYFSWFEKLNDELQDEIIYIHKHWLPAGDRIYPQNLHLQFHGREMHSLCFIFDGTQFKSDETGFLATGCEDGTVRLTRYSLGVGSWSASKLLGEHVGGSAVRSLCSVSKVHTIVDDVINRQVTPLDDPENHFLLISVGAKRVLTAWKRKICSTSKSQEALESTDTSNNCGHFQSGGSSSMSFQWLSSNFPTRNSGTNSKGSNREKTSGNFENVSTVNSLPPEKREPETNVCFGNGHENDWRYLAVTAFLVKFSGSRTSVCFVVVSCSDATVTLRALVLPHRLWFDIALLVPLASPVLSLQHVIVPERPSFKDKSEMRSVFMIISGSTDGSIGFWDVSESVETFMRKVSALGKEDCSNFQSRPRTGRGSQGGRWWRSLDTEKTEQTSSNFSSQEIEMVRPLHVVNNAHQSGVNCLHVSQSKDCESCFSYNVISGGDDQALHCVRFDVMVPPLSHYSEMEDKSSKKHIYCCEKNKYQIVFSHPDEIASAHSSAVKGVWTDGRWVFSTGLDQRVRCWRVSVHGKLSEHAHLIVSVPEPEALDVRACGRNHYQIAVAGRGMQMLQFLAPADG